MSNVHEEERFIRNMTAQNFIDALTSEGKRRVISMLSHEYAGGDLAYMKQGVGVARVDGTDIKAGPVAECFQLILSANVVSALHPRTNWMDGLRGGYLMTKAFHAFRDQGGLCTASTEGFDEVVGSLIKKQVAAVIYDKAVEIFDAADREGEFGDYLIWLSHECEVFDEIVALMPEHLRDDSGEDPQPAHDERDAFYGHAEVIL